MCHYSIPLRPLKDMRQIKGPIYALLDPENYSRENTMDYIHATLTDEDEIYDAIGQLRSIYPNIMSIEFENSKTMWNSQEKIESNDIKEKTSMELFSEFFENQNNIPMSKEQEDIMMKMFQEALEEKVGEQ